MCVEYRYLCVCVCSDEPLTAFICFFFHSSGVWAEERDPQAAGVQESRDQIFLQWVYFDLFTSLFNKKFLGAEEWI